MEQDSLPAVPDGYGALAGLTHAATVPLGDKTFLCGGSVGGLPHPTTDLCHAYTHTAPAGQKWEARLENDFRFLSYGDGSLLFVDPNP